MLTGIYRYPPMDTVAFGEPWQEALPKELERVGASRAFVLASTNLAAAASLTAELRSLLGPKLAGFSTGIRVHTPRDDVVAAAEKARDANADVIVTMGGGSVTDAGKMLLLCLTADVRDAAALDAYRAPQRPALPEKLALRMIAVPTTLSGGEFTSTAGCTDLRHQMKESFAHAEMMPRTVILDPRITVHTPLDLWLSTGIRAVDHAVETLCSIKPQPLFDATAMHALRLLSRALPRTKADPTDLNARLDSALGVWLSIFGGQARAPMGASHAIGHVLGGTAGVPHGVTSCIMLAHVLRWNKSINAERQALVSEAFGAPEREAADLVADLVKRLELPASLRAAGVKRDQLGIIAENSMHDRWISTNPRPISGPPDVMHLLEQAW
jgi:maleylacetate reductase